MKLIVPLLLLAALSGCGLRPLYGTGESGSVAQVLRSVEVGPIDGKAGWLMRQALSDRLRSGDGVTARYRLNIELDDRISGIGVRADDVITRERRTLRARFQLIDNATAKPLFDATAGSDSGIDVVSSEYATVAAENTALERLSQTVADQIVARIALHIQSEQDAVPAPQ
jgi:LPS-assembly lipoprotein